MRRRAGDAALGTGDVKRLSAGRQTSAVAAAATAATTGSIETTGARQHTTAAFIADVSEGKKKTTTNAGERPHQKNPLATERRAGDVTAQAVEGWCARGCRCRCKVARGVREKMVGETGATWKYGSCVQSNI